MIMNNKLYDILKWIAMVGLPAIGALYCAMATIWNIGYVEQVMGTITAINTFLGAVLGISSNKYKKSDNSK